MKLSTRARYSLRCMIAVSKMGGGDRPVPIDRVAEGANISPRYLQQLAITLKNASLLRSVSGRGGGYCLAASHDLMLDEFPPENVVAMYDEAYEYGRHARGDRRKARPVAAGAGRRAAPPRDTWGAAAPRGERSFGGC